MGSRWRWDFIKESALSPFLVSIGDGQVDRRIRQEPPWTVVFADHIVMFSESREEVEEQLER